MKRPLRTLFFFLIILAISLGPQSQGNCAQSTPEASSTEALFYTIQIGSYSDKDEAISWYKRLAEQLPDTAKPYLRVESIPPFFAVRLGKAEARQDIITLLEEAQKITKKPPAILHGYYRLERILTSYDPNAPAEKQPGTTAPDSKAQIPSPSREEPLDTPPSGQVVAQPRPNRPQGTTKKPSAPQIPDAALKQRIIDKYLASEAANPKAKEALIKHSQTYPESASCSASGCHADYKSLANLHEPVQNNRCSACHKQLNQNHPKSGSTDFQLVATGAALCNSCHPTLQGKKYSHEPAAKGECLECHSPHGGENQFFLKTEGNNQKKLCLSCHDEQITANKFNHGPVDLGACTYCHNPHESDHQALLNDEPQKLCFDCHTDIAEGVKSSTSIHKVVETGDCSTCHLSHGSQFPSLLKERGESFCFTCHPGIEEQYTKSKSKHAGLYLEKGCNTCHLPHFSENKHLLKENELDLCLTCHSEKNSISSKSPKDIAIELKRTFLHEPVAQGQCSVCHNAHGSKFLKLLIGPYPDSIYAPYDPDIYDLCFTCHDKGLLTSQTTDSDTSFRNGKKNLHYLHAAIPQKGRTCKTCHEAHASNGPKLINQTGSSFGEWQMSISFSTSGPGGSCMPGCHRKMEYNRDREIDNSVKETNYGTYHVEYESIK
ncbi:MAG: cytochrome c3 family protein [Desulfobulbaceae bacterium]|nr:cytochrome c3 family protein [Desulfobulbaceae bacterium]